MSNGVFTRMKRFTFVEKTSTEVGDYTDFPIEVTGATVNDRFDKIAEIYYRVKYAQFTSNELALGGSTEGSILSGVTTGTISPRIMTADDGGVSHESGLMSGYWSLDDLGLPSAASALPFLSEQYSVDMGLWFSTSGGGNTTPVTFRDIGDRESGLFLKPNEGENPTWNKQMGDYFGLGYYFYTGFGTEYGLNDQDFKTAFSHYSISPAGTLTQPTIPIPWIAQIYFGDILYEELAILVQFSGEVGWVGESLYHPDTKFYLGMRVDGYNGSLFSSWNTAFEPVYSRYIMRLSTGDLSCALNSDNPSYLSGDFYTGDIVHEAIEWWPYAKDSPAVPVWGTDTGLKL